MVVMHGDADADDDDDDDSQDDNDLRELPNPARLSRSIAPEKA